MILIIYSQSVIVIVILFLAVFLSGFSFTNICDSQGIRGRRRVSIFGKNSWKGSVFGYTAACVGRPDLFLNEFHDIETF